MKMMSFNSSCAYAGLANMLEALGVDTEDRLIALDMGLPYLFAREEGQYRAGPMLQSARWFDLYLRPRGFALREENLPQEQLPQYLPAHAPAMLGLLVGRTASTRWCSWGRRAMRSASSTTGIRPRLSRMN